MDISTFGSVSRRVGFALVFDGLTLMRTLTLSSGTMNAARTRAINRRIFTVECFKNEKNTVYTEGLKFAASRECVFHAFVSSVVRGVGFGVCDDGISIRNARKTIGVGFGAMPLVAWIFFEIGADFFLVFLIFERFVNGVDGGGEAVGAMRFGLMYAWRIFEIFGYGSAFLEASIFLFGW